MKLTCNTKLNTILMNIPSKDLMPSDIADQSLYGQVLKNLMKKSLNIREMMVIDYRMGLTDGVIRTFKEIGDYFHVSRERIRTIESKAFRKLRHPSNNKILSELFYSIPS